MQVRAVQGGATGSRARGAVHLWKVGDRYGLEPGCGFIRLAATPNGCSNVSVMVL
jgi:hypothetical protein